MYYVTSQSLSTASEDNLYNVWIDTGKLDKKKTFYNPLSNIDYQKSIFFYLFKMIILMVKLELLVDPSRQK